MSKENLLKYAKRSENNKKKFFALRNWCDRNANRFTLQEVFDCLYDAANGDENEITKLIEQLTDKKKVFGRASLVLGSNEPAMTIVHDSNGRVVLQGYDPNFTKGPKGQHQAHSSEVLRKDGQMKRNVINTREKLYDLGKDVREIYTGQSNEFITYAMKAIKDYAKLHKISEDTVVNNLKSGTYVLNTSEGLTNAKIVSKKKRPRIVKVNESQVRGLNEATKLTEYKFYNNVQRFLSDLLKDPVGAKVPFLLQANNIARNQLLYHLKSNGIIIRHNKISDKDSQGNPKTARMVIKYSVPKKDFIKKMKKLFISMVAKNVPEKNEKLVSECDCGGCMGGNAEGNTASNSGQFTQPLFGVQRRKMPTDLDEDTTTSSVGNYEYTVPFGGDKETLSRGKGKGGSTSVNVVNEDMMKGFSLEQLKSIPSHDDRMSYCRKFFR